MPEATPFYRICLLNEVREETSIQSKLEDKQPT